MGLWRRVVIVLTVTGSVAIATLGLVATGASASASCSPANHCYGIALWKSTPATYGSGGNLEFQCLYTSNDNDFVNEEMWQGTNDDPYGLSNWVEEGGRTGEPNGSARYFFWADERSGGYNQHFPSGAQYSVSLNTTYSAEMAYDGSNEWEVDWNGDFVAYSTSNPPNGEYLSAGTEALDNADRTVGTDSSLYYLDTTHEVHFGWSGAATNDQGGLTTTTWVGSGHNEVSWASAC